MRARDSAVSLPTVFFMGLFVMVAGLVHTGVIGAIGDWAVAAIGDEFLLAATALLFGSGVLGAFFDNIPYVATMTPVVEGVVEQAPDHRTGHALWWAFALGADFGGNGTAVATSANVVALGIASRSGHRRALNSALLRTSLAPLDLDRVRRGERVPGQVLTPREDVVVKLIAEGHSTKEIAAALTISPKTVERHRANILQKLGMRDRTELTRYAIRAGLIEP
jgi:DNA-binding CsgD family transcriptional regulator